MKSYDERARGASPHRGQAAERRWYVDNIVMTFMSLADYEDHGGEYDDGANGGEAVDRDDFSEAVKFSGDTHDYLIDAALAECGDWWSDSCLDCYLLQPASGQTVEEMRGRMRRAAQLAAVAMGD